MSLTIQNTPGTYYSVNDDLIYTVCDIVKASDPVTYPDFRYVCDIYVSSVFVARLKAYPNPTNKIGVFNVSNVVRAYIAATFNPSPNILKCQALGVGEFTVGTVMKFGYEYGFTLYADVTIDTNRSYFGHYNGRLIGARTNLSAVVDKAATVRPLQTPVNKTDNYCFLPHFLADTDAINITIKSYNQNDTLLGTYTTVFTPLLSGTMYIFNVSPNVINITSPGLINPAIASYYTVQFSGDSIYRFNLTCECKYEVFTLHFLNKYGGFESRNFTKVSRKTIDIDKSEFGKLGYIMDISGVISYSNANKVYNETRSIYASQFKEKMMLNTDILTDGEYTWLGDLVVSPMVYIEISGYFIPCVIVSNNYDYRKAKNDSLTNLTINIEFGEQFNAQYR